MTNNRIKTLNKLAGGPEYFAYKARDDGNKLTTHKFEIYGGGRVLTQCKWNEEEVDNLTDSEFNHIVGFLTALKTLNERYKNMDIIEFLTTFGK